MIPIQFAQKSRLNKLVAFCLLLSLSCFSNSKLFAQTVNWVGGTSTDYFTVTNWSDTTIKFSSIASTTLNIGPGKPNYCYLAGGSTATAYRPSRLNTQVGAQFTVAGTVYPANIDSLNGTIEILSGADFNCRGNVFSGINGRVTINMLGGKLTSKAAMYFATGTAGSSAVINANGGSINVGTNLYLASGTGLQATLNISGAGVSIGGSLNIGDSANIFIEGIGFLKIGGNDTAQLNALVANGQLTCPVGKTLSITYNATTNTTTAQLPFNSNSMIREYPDSVVLSTGKVTCVIDKNSANVLSYRYGNVETVSNSPTATHKYMYHDFTTSAGFETINGGIFSILEDTTDFAHIVIKRPYTPSIGHVTPCDAEFHYAIKRNDMGVYVYSKLEHKPSYPNFDLGSWRQVWWIANTKGVNLCERIYTDSLRSWQMPSAYDYTTGVGSGGPQEIIKLTTGVRAGKFDGKYEYSLKFWEHPVWGHASNKNKIGSWCVNANCEYYNTGPTYHDLNAAAGIIHQCMNGVHYGQGGLTADSLTSWKKVYGPYLLLITNNSTGDSNWLAARQRQELESKQWPYAWVKDTVAYPHAEQRGNITGTFKIVDSLKPSLTGAGAWVGVTNLADGKTSFQLECKDYQYWTKADSLGNFTITNVRPGTYSLFAYVDGVVGEFRQDKVIVTTGGITNMGTLTKKVDRSYGRLVWEIGTPNRMADEFKMGDFDYCEGNIQFKFRDSFPNPIEYNIADGDYAKKLCYAHTRYPDTAAIPNPGNAWLWRLNFTLPKGFSTKGNARITIAYASNDHAQQQIFVNNESSAFTSYYPANGDGNAFLRQTNFALYSYKQTLIPMSRFVAGKNTITLGMPSGSGWVSHLMYDYLSLEANVPDVLPINLQSFTAEAVANNKVLLNWKLATETNSSNYIVEKSTDGITFISLGNVAAGNKSSTNAYTFTDLQPTVGTNYYRLKLVSTNGETVYSNVKQVVIIAEAAFSISPNPASNQLLVVAKNNKPLQQIALYNALGKECAARKNITANQLKLDISLLPAGIYICKIKQGETTYSYKVVKQ